jgi:predicted transcriptional regulator
MVQENAFDELLEFFKALADANRLKIVGLLAQDALTVEQMAEMLGLSASTVSHHLARLSKAGLVSAKAESYYSVYSLETGALEAMAKRLLTEDVLPAAAEDVDRDAYDRKVLRSYLTPEGRIQSFPSQRKKLEVILRYVVERFEHGERYSEKQINVILGKLTEDTAGLRRDLVDFGLLDRERGGSAYWRTERSGA